MGISNHAPLLRTLLSSRAGDAREQRTVAALRVELQSVCAFYASCPQQLRVELAKTATLEAYRVGESVFRTGDMGDKLYIVLSGQLAVWKEAGPIPQRGGSYGVSRQSTHSLASRGPGSAASSMHGSTAGARSLQGASNKPKPQLLRHLTPGMSFGDVGTLNRIPRHSTIKAVQKTECVVLHVPLNSVADRLLRRLWDGVIEERLQYLQHVAAIAQHVSLSDQRVLAAYMQPAVYPAGTVFSPDCGGQVSFIADGVARYCVVPGVEVAPWVQPDVLLDGRKPIVLPYKPYSETGRHLPPDEPKKVANGPHGAVDTLVPPHGSDPTPQQADTQPRPWRSSKVREAPAKPSYAVESEADLDALAAASQIPDWVAARIAKRKAAEKLKAAERAAAAAAERARLGGRSSMHGGARSSMHGGGARSSMHGGDARSSMHVLPTESPSEPDEQATKPTYGRTHSEVFRLFKGMHFGLTHMFKELQFHGACVQALSELHVLTVQLVDLRRVLPDKAQEVARKELAFQFEMGARRQEFRDHHLEQNDNLFKNRPITIAHDRHKAALPPAQLPKLPKENLRDNLGEAEVEPLTHSISVIVEEDSEGAWATVPLEDSHCTMVMDAHMPKRDGAGAESRPARRGTLGPGDIRFEAPGGITPKRVTFPAIRRAHRGAKDFASDQSLSSTPRSARLMELYRERQELRDEERRREHQAAQQLCCSMADDGDDRSPASKAQSGSPIRSSASPTRAKPANKRCSSPVQCFLKSHPKHAHRISTQDLVAASLELRMI